MNGLILQKIVVRVRHGLPFCLTFFLVLLSVVPTGIPGYADIAPILPIMSIYHWAIYRPELLPVWGVFLLASLYDFISGAPLGFFLLVFLTVYGVVVTQRRFIIGKSFLIYWLGYSIIAMGVGAEIWVLGSLWHLSLLNPYTILFQYVISLGIFPAVAWVCLQMQSSLLRPD